jgi:hypothetical protein
VRAARLTHQRVGPLDDDRLDSFCRGSVGVWLLFAQARRRGSAGLCRRHHPQAAGPAASLTGASFSGRSVMGSRASATPWALGQVEAVRDDLAARLQLADRTYDGPVCSAARQQLCRTASPAALEISNSASPSQNRCHRRHEMRQSKTDFGSLGHMPKSATRHRLWMPVELPGDFTCVALVVPLGSGEVAAVSTVVAGMRHRWVCWLPPEPPLSESP